MHRNTLPRSGAVAAGMAIVAIVAALAGEAWAQGSVLFEDTFSDGDPSDWLVFRPGWSEADGLRLARNTEPSQEVASVWPLGFGWSDYAVESDVRILDERTVSQSGLVFRFNSPFPNSDYCRCGFFHGVPNVPGLPSGKYLRLVCNGVDNVQPFGFVAGQFYRLRATAVGKTATCEVLGHPEVPRLVTTADAIGCTGTAGLRSTHIRSDFDNFLVTRISAPPDPACLEVPIADAGPDQVLEADSACTALAVLDGSGSTPPLGAQLVFEWTGAFGSASGAQVSYLLPPGVHEFTLTVTDSDGDSDSDETTVTVLDVDPPSLEAVKARPSVLWPPNHRMVPVDVIPMAEDNCDQEVLCKIVSVTSDEPVRGSGSGQSDPDWEMTGDLSVNLRAERAGRGHGRTYTIETECTDSSGNVTVGRSEVQVPHDNS